jgi:hypothetical protein
MPINSRLSSSSSVVTPDSLRSCSGCFIASLNQFNGQISRIRHYRQRLPILSHYQQQSPPLHRHCRLNRNAPLWHCLKPLPSVGVVMSSWRGGRGMYLQPKQSKAESHLKQVDSHIGLCPNAYNPQPKTESDNRYSVRAYNL